jgi:hypothetical protein
LPRDWQQVRKRASKMSRGGCISKCKGTEVGACSLFQEECWVRRAG